MTEELGDINLWTRGQADLEKEDTVTRDRQVCGPETGMQRAYKPGDRETVDGRQWDMQAGGLGDQNTFTYKVQS